MPMQVYQLSESGKRAIEILEKAIGQIRDGEDAIPTIGHAEAELRIEAGELQPDDGPPCTHGTRLGREHRSVRIHLVEDHGVTQDQVDAWSDGAVHGHHDGVHRTTWAYANDLDHPAPGDREYQGNAGAAQIERHAAEHAAQLGETAEEYAAN